MRVAVLGAGYAGLTVARRLERSLPESVELVVVDESGTHLVQHELHRLLRRPDLEETITVSLEDILQKATIRTTRVTGVDTEAGVATLKADGETTELRYDVGVVCLGAETAYYDLPGLEEHGLPLKRSEHAHEIRRRALSAEGGDVVVGGAGLSGIQVAGELAALSAETGLGLDVRLVEMDDHIAPGFDATFAAALRRELEARGVTIETATTVERADAETLQLADSRTLPYDIFVWTGGIRGPDALDGERTSVGADLQVSESTFVVGDAGPVTDEDGTAVPASAQTAVAEARVAAENVRRAVNERQVTDETDGKKHRHTYAFESPGWAVSVGDGAVAQVGSLVVSGDPAKAVKAVIGASHLGSVGAIGRASELVREELGWPGPAGVDVPFDARMLADGKGTDPSSLGELQRNLLGPLFDASEQFVPGETVDLTAFTRLADRSYPGTPANLIERTVSRSVETALGTHQTDERDESD